MKLRNIITNEICVAEAREDGIYIKANWSDEEKWFCYDLKTLARGWDYYVEPKEPLIKQEKIRKAVRAWAEACRLTHVTYKLASNEFYDADTRGKFAIKFTLIPVEVYLKDGESYTIDELCGEEEE